MPNPFLAPAIIFAILILVFVVTAFKARKFEYQCTKCKTKFSANPAVAAIAPQSNGKKHLYCPSCHKKQFCNLIYKG